MVEYRGSVYIDAGANLGDTVSAYHAKNPNHFLIAIEPNASLIPRLTEIFLRSGIRGSIVNAAIWVEDSTINLYHGHHETSTVLLGKIVPSSYKRQIDYSNPVRVPCIDFSEMIRSLRQYCEHVVVKMDVEGAEYQVCEKMLADGTLTLISQLYCEWHWDRFPATFTHEYHLDIVSRVAKYTDLRPWH